jgi:hypothetical protein
LQGPEALRHSPKTNVQNRFLSCCFEVKLITLKNLSVSQSDSYDMEDDGTILSQEGKGRGVSTRGKSMSVRNRTRGSSLSKHMSRQRLESVCIRQTCHTPNANCWQKLLL